MQITKDTKLKDINEAPAFAQAKGHLISGGDFFGSANGDMTLVDLQKKNPTWNHEDILYGLERLQQVAEIGVQYVYPVYSTEEVENNARLAQVQLFYLPAKKQKYSTFAVLLAGGAYGAVCTMVESLPVAARLNELGISCFCLNYRIATPKSFIKGLLPQPLEDLAAAWRFIQQNQALFGVDANTYIVGGFSAGGHVTSLWGTTELGARNYGVPQPAMLMLAYPLISMTHIPRGPVKTMLCTGMFGAGYTAKSIRHYDASTQIDASYPKTYLVRSRDDSTVSIEDGDALAAAMKQAGVPYKIEEAPTGGHGFGLGTATPLNGWVERAVAFLKGESA